MSNLECFSFLFFFCSSLLVCSFFSSFLPACCSFSLVLFFLFFFRFFFSCPARLRSVVFYFRFSLRPFLQSSIQARYHAMMACQAPGTKYKYIAYTDATKSTIMTNQHTSLEKYTSHTLFEKGLCVRGELEIEQTATYWPPVSLSLAAFLSRSAGLLNRGSWGP